MNKKLPLLKEEHTEQAWKYYCGLLGVNDNVSELELTVCDVNGLTQEDRRQEVIDGLQSKITEVANKLIKQAIGDLTATDKHQLRKCINQIEYMIDNY